jgi:hypothetical protein
MESQYVLCRETESLIDVCLYEMLRIQSLACFAYLLLWAIHNPLLPPHTSIYGHDQLPFFCFANQIMAVVVFAVHSSFLCVYFSARNMQFTIA